MNFGDLNLNQLYIISQMASRGIEKIDEDLKEQAKVLVEEIRREIDEREISYWEDK